MRPFSCVCIILFAGFVLLWSSQLHGAQQTGGGRAAPTSEIQKFQQIEDRWSEAVNERDQYALEFALSPEFLEVSAAGDVTTRNLQIALLVQNSAGTISRDSRVANVRTFGDLTVVIGTYVEQLRANDRTVESRGLFTHVYHRVRGNWLCVNSHRTAVVEPAPQKTRGGKKEDSTKPPFHLPLLDGSDSYAKPPASSRQK